MLSHILSSKCIFEFPSQPIPNHTRVKIGQDIHFSSTNTPARGKAPCLGTSESVSEAQIVLIIRKDLKGNERNIRALLEWKIESNV